MFFHNNTKDGESHSNIIVLLSSSLFDKEIIVLLNNFSSTSPSEPFFRLQISVPIELRRSCLEPHKYTRNNLYNFEIF